MRSYNKKGLYNSYDKKYKERDSLDYYSTPTEEVLNILNTLNVNLNDTIILEPCCGRWTYDTRNSRICKKYQ